MMARPARVDGAGAQCGRRAECLGRLDRTSLDS